MFKTLFNTNVNWSLYVTIALFIRLLFPQMDWYIYFAIMIFIHQFLLLFYAIGSIIPVRYLLGTFMCLQILLGPSFAYLGADEVQRQQYRMQIPLDEYFSYAIPAVLAFIAGLHITAGKLKGEFINQKAISEFADQNPHLPYYMVGFGFLFSVLMQMVPAEVGFVLVLLANLKYIGVFLIVLREKQLNVLPLVLVIASVVLSSLAGAMFHDLLTWALFIGSVMAIRYKPSVSFKTMVTVGFMLLAFLIQRLKGGYRQEVWYGNSEAGLETLEKVYEAKTEKGGFFSLQSFSESNLRINQGFIISHIMRNVPAKIPFQNGEQLMKIIESAILPRVLAPNKLNAGDRDFFMQYSGMRIRRGTSMALGSPGDAYINFGRSGGVVFMFCYGLLFSMVLGYLYKASIAYPIITLFSSLIFYYPIRPDCELQTILGHLFKATFLVYVIFLFFKRESAKQKRKPAATPNLNAVP
ncbi:MAG TPA: hypothetical protein PKC39_09855 [Ferruginibacter sp.]|nr:hypothetical protein [Ferruginibacter sp.]HMP21252.1 hypothetical protein [Ferruginibacter sp.]